LRAQFYQLRCAVRTEELIVGDLGGQHEDLLWATSARSPAATFFRVQRQGLQIFLPIGCRRQSTCLIRARGSFAPHPQRHLANFTGLLQADAFAGYADLYLGGQIHEAACMAHARRKLHDRHAVRASPITSEALERIGALYRIEEHIRGKPPEERRRVRQEKAVPLLDDMKRWFETTLLTLSAKSDTTKAIQYSLNRWPALVYYCSDGQTEIDNLIAERALRGVAIGRRNFLFAGAG
jgi:hypothetical protein